MRITHVYVSAVLLAACSHASPGPAPHAQSKPPSETRHNLGELQPSSVTAEARHEPGAPDPSIAAAAPPAAPQAPAPLAPSAAPVAPSAAPLAPSAAPLANTNAAPQPAAAPTSGGTVDAPQPTREESALRERIQTRLSQEKRLSYTAQHVRLEVRQSDVTVQGEVRTAREKQDVAQIIESIAGVRHVNNQLAVINQTMPAAASGPSTR